MVAIAFLYLERAWKLALLVVVLVLFACIGVAHVINPDPFIKRSGAPKGGEMLTAVNRLGFRVVGVVFAGFALYGLNVVLWDVFAK